MNKVKSASIVLLSLLLIGCSDQRLSRSELSALTQEIEEFIIRHEVKNKVYGETGDYCYFIPRSRWEESSGRLGDLQNVQLVTSPTELEGEVVHLYAYGLRSRKSPRRKLVRADRRLRPHDRNAPSTQSMYLLDKGLFGWQVVGQHRETRTLEERLSKKDIVADAPTKGSLAIAEAVFRYQFKHNAAGKGVPSPQTTCFLQIGEGDPDQAFLDRFSDRPFSVKAGSEFPPEHSGGNILFRVGGMMPLSPSIMLVSGGHYVGSLGASRCFYIAEKTLFGWIVTDRFLLWIS